MAAVQHFRAGEKTEAIASAIGVLPGVGQSARWAYTTNYAGKAAEYGTRTAGRVWRQVAQGFEAGTFWGGGVAQWLQNFNDWTTISMSCQAR